MILNLIFNKAFIFPNFLSKCFNNLFVYNMILINWINIPIPKMLKIKIDIISFQNFFLKLFLNN